MSATTSFTASSATAEEPSPPSQLLIPPLTDDVSVNCVARVPRCCHPCLALVSKGLGSLLTSTDLYFTRSLLGCSEQVLYLCVGGLDHTKHYWYELARKPFEAQSSAATTEHPSVLVKSFPCPSRVQFTTVSVGPEIYFIGGLFNGISTSRVSIFDCRTRTYREGPDMLLPRDNAAGVFVDGKIYIAGGRRSEDWEHWAEVFDLETQTWEFVPIPSVELRNKWAREREGMRRFNLKFQKNAREVAVMDGKIYFISSRNTVSYEPKEGRWEVEDEELHAWWSETSVVVDNVLYRLGMTGGLIWYDAKEKDWKYVSGVYELPLDLDRVFMVNRGEKLGLFWQIDSQGPCAAQKEVWYGEIVFEGLDEDHNRVGRFEWSKPMLTVNDRDYILECANATF